MIFLEGITTLSVVRKERLELSHLTILEPKSSASTNSATFAFFVTIHYYQSINTIKMPRIGVGDGD